MGNIKEITQPSLLDVNFKSKLLLSKLIGRVLVVLWLLLLLNAKSMGIERRECIHNRSFFYTLLKSCHPLVPMIL